MKGSSDPIQYRQLVLSLLEVSPADGAGVRSARNAPSLPPPALSPGGNRPTDTSPAPMIGKLTFAAAAGASGPAGLNSLCEPLAVSFDPSEIAPRLIESQTESFEKSLALGSDRFRPVLATPTENNNEPPRLPYYRNSPKLSLVRTSRPPQRDFPLDPAEPPTEASKPAEGESPSAADFVADTPPAQPTAAGGSSAPVYETAGFPLYPVWLPALFSLAKRKVSLNTCASKYQGAIPTQPRGADPLGAEGPSFSGTLARPAPRAPLNDFKDKASRLEPDPPNDEPKAAPAKRSPESNARDIGFKTPGRASLSADFLIRSWRSAPVLLRGIALAAPVVFTILYFGPKVKVAEQQKETPAGPSSWNHFVTKAKARATVDIREDFRSQSESWIMKPGRGIAWTFNEGSAKPGKLGIFQPTVPLSNYKLEFLGQIESKAMSFVFRASDTENYQAVKLIVVKPDAVPTLGMVRYTVINGKPGPKVQTPLPIEGLRRDTIYKLVVDVQGDNFTVTVNGMLAAGWSDSRLKSGGVGFFSEKGESARVRSLHVIDHQDFLGWLCSQVSWWTADRQKSGVTQHE